jgi:hypothetical protein
MSVRAVIVSMLRSVSTTPFGRPVVPPVPTTITVSSGGASANPVLSTSPRAPSQASSSSRQTRVGSSSPSTISAYERAYSSATQSNRASISRFSAIVLRGLIGHHTAPRRAMPNTQANARASLPERMATLSPARTPERARARATACENSWTSP